MRRNARIYVKELREGKRDSVVENIEKVKKRGYNLSRVHSGLLQNWKSWNCQGNWKRLRKSGKSQAIFQNYVEKLNSWL